MRSPSEVDLDDLLGDIIQDYFRTLAHPIPKLSEVYFISGLLLFAEVLLEDDAETLVVREDVVEGVADHQHREEVV